MRLERVQELLGKKQIAFTYTEEDGLGSLDFLYRGVPYHIWEFADEEEPCGVETNIRNAGKDEEIEGDYEEALLRELKQWS
ncbi:MAG: kinase [Candidatus Limivivens sp.]|nr:kinase [Candidatus Limivivens sp.]